MRFRFRFAWSYYRLVGLDGVSFLNSGVCSKCGDNFWGCGPFYLSPRPQASPPQAPPIQSLPSLLSPTNWNPTICSFIHNIRSVSLRTSLENSSPADGGPPRKLSATSRPRVAVQITRQL